MRYTLITRVASESNYNKKYEIKIDENGLLSCNCASWIFNQRRNRTCKHIDSLRGSVLMDQVGKVGRLQSGLPMVCYNYPNGCDDCHFRFQCWTSREVDVKGREE